MKSKTPPSLDPINVFGVEYEVKFRDGTEDRGVRTLLGESNSTSCELMVNTAAAELRQRSTLLHELIHAVSINALGCAKQLTEREVNALEAGLFGALRNSDAAAWIFFGMTRGKKK